MIIYRHVIYMSDSFPESEVFKGSGLVYSYLRECHFLLPLVCFFDGIILICFKHKYILKADECQSSIFVLFIKAVLCSTIITAHSLPIVLSQTLHVHTVPHQFVLIPAYLSFNLSSDEWA